MRHFASIAVTLSTITAVLAAPAPAGLLGGVVDTVAPITGGVGDTLNGLLGFGGPGSNRGVGGGFPGGGFPGGSGYPGGGFPGGSGYPSGGYHGGVAPEHGLNGYGNYGVNNYDSRNNNIVYGN
ncbi:hypothetical protein LPJ81_007188, partial [Coemansia sp. IMI 209127]